MKTILFSLLLCLFTCEVWATTPSYNATDGVNSGSDFTYTVTSLTITHSVSGTNPYLIVGVSTADVAAVTATFNATAMTALCHIDDVLVTNYRLTLFGLAAPAAGSHNVVVTGPGAVIQIEVYALTYNNVNQSVSTGACATANMMSTMPSVVVASASGELVIDCVIAYGMNTMTPDVSQTRRYDGDAVRAMDASDKPGATSVTMQWTYAINYGWAIAGLSLKPDAGGGGGGGTSHTLTLLGVGK